MRWAAVVGVLLAAGCGGQDSPVVELIVDAPTDVGEQTDPYLGVDRLRLEVVERESGQAASATEVSIGESLMLPDVGFSDDLAVHMTGIAIGNFPLSYGRTCSFSATADEQPQAVHLYFAKLTSFFDTLAPQSTDRAQGVAFATAEGHAVLLGGTGMAPMELYDPLLNVYKTLDVPLGRVGSRVMALPDGRAVVIGGSVPGGGLVSSLLLIDARPNRTGAVRSIVAEGLGLIDHAAESLADGSVLFCGGRESSESVEPIAKATVVEYNGAALSPSPSPVDPLILARRDHSMVRLGQGDGAVVLVTGGRDATGMAVGEAELYLPLQKQFVSLAGPIADVPQVGRLQVPRWGHASKLLAGGRAVVVGGFTNDIGDPSAAVPVSEIELYDPVSKQFSVVDTLFPGVGLTDFALTELPDGSVLLSGGKNLSGAVTREAALLEVNSETGELDKFLLSGDAGMRVARAGHAAVLLCDGTVLLVGGTGDDGHYAERFNARIVGRR